MNSSVEAIWAALGSKEKNLFEYLSKRIFFKYCSVHTKKFSCCVSTENAIFYYVKKTNHVDDKWKKIIQFDKKS